MRIGNIVFNVNHYAEVVLTAVGADHANRIDATFNRLRRPWKEGDIYREQLWLIMKEFGPLIKMWELPFKTEMRLIDEERIGHKGLRYHR